MRIVESNTWAGRELTVTWDDAPMLPPHHQITQASGVCFTDTGKIVLVGSGNGRWSLPGGHPEPGETIEETLIREIREEACAVVERCAYLGSQRVDDPAETVPYFQTRWWARVRLLPFEPRYETTERKLVDPHAFVATLDWNTTRIAQAILYAASMAQSRTSYIQATM